MATLTETAYYARKTIKYGSISIVALLIFRSFFISFKAYWKKAHPKPPPPPTVAFGKLPKLSFPSRPNLPPIALRQETITGAFSALPTQAKVYFIPQPAVSLLAWDKTKAWAKNLGFTKEPETVETYTLRYTTDTSPKTTLEVNVLTRNFTLLYDWRNDLEVLYQGTVPSQDQAISQVKSFLQNADSLTEDLIQGPAETIYFKYENGNLIKPRASSEANFIKVNLFRQSLDGIRILPPNPKDSNVSFLLSSSSNKKGVLEAKFIHSTISETNYATYPLKDVNTAWGQLASGKGFIANLGDNPDGKVTVREAYLAYYDSDTPQNFLQPVIVFEGDNDFFAYVPAVSDNWRE